MPFAHFLKFAVLVCAVIIIIDPAYAQNNKPIRSGNWYEDRAVGTSNSSYLVLSFAQAPTDKFLNITHVFCNTSNSTDMNLGFASLGGSTASGGAGDLGRSQTFRET